MIRAAFILILAALALAGCAGDVKIDETGVTVKDPEREAKAAQLKQQTATEADAATYELETKRMAQKAQADALKVEADARAYETRVMAEARAESEKIKLAKQAESAALVTTAFGVAVSIALVLGSVAAVVWFSGESVAGAYNAIQSSKLVKIGVDPVTMQPPPLVITGDGMLLDTRTGERAKMRDAVGVNQLLLAAVTHNLDIIILARAAQEIAKSNSKPGSGGAQVGDILPAIAQNVQTLTIEQPGEAYSPTGEAYSPTGEAYSPTGEAYSPTGEAYSPTSPDRDITQLVKEKSKTQGGEK